LFAAAVLKLKARRVEVAPERESYTESSEVTALYPASSSGVERLAEVPGRLEEEQSIELHLAKSRWPVTESGYAMIG